MEKERKKEERNKGEEEQLWKCPGGEHLLYSRC
jgi:hypothetical protein